MRGVWSTEEKKGTQVTTAEYVMLGWCISYAALGAIMAERINRRIDRLESDYQFHTHEQPEKKPQDEYDDNEESGVFKWEPDDSN